MGDMAEDFNLLKQLNLKRRQELTPKRFKYAAKKLNSVVKEAKISMFYLGVDTITIKLPNGTVTFWPFTGWFQGQKPYGRIKGRGIEKLIRMLKNSN